MHVRAYVTIIIKESHGFERNWGTGGVREERRNGGRDRNSHIFVKKILKKKLQFRLKRKWERKKTKTKTLSSVASHSTEPFPMSQTIPAQN